MDADAMITNQKVLAQYLDIQTEAVHWPSVPLIIFSKAVSLVGLVHQLPNFQQIIMINALFRKIHKLSSRWYHTCHSKITFARWTCLTSEVFWCVISAWQYRGPKWPPLYSNTTCYRIYYLWNSNLLSHTEFTTCETAISYLTQNLPPYNLGHGMAALPDCKQVVHGTQASSSHKDNAHKYYCYRVISNARKTIRGWVLFMWVREDFDDETEGSNACPSAYAHVFGYVSTSCRSHRNQLCTEHKMRKR